jgi:conjugal transfer ATP-binding protein TraC
MVNALVEKFEPWGFEDGITLFKDKSLGFTFKIKSQDISCEPDEKVNQIKVQLRSFLGSLPSDIDVQFVQAIDKAGTTDLDEHLSYSKNAIPMIRQVAEVRHRKFAELDDVGALPSQENFVFIRVPFDDQTSAKVGVFDMKFARSREESEARLHCALSRAATMRAEIERNLIAAGFVVERLTPPEIVLDIFGAWNPNHLVGLGEFDETDIRDQVLLSELVKDVRGFRLGTTHHRVVTLKVLPEQTFAGMAASLVDLPFASRLYLSFHVPDQAKEIEWLKLNRRMAYAMVIGKKGVSDVESEAKLQDIEELLSQVVKDGEKIFTASLAIVLRSENVDELDGQVSHVLQVIRELSGSEGFMETYAAFDIFSACTVPNAKNKERAKRMRSSNLADLLPVFGLWNGFEKPSVLLRTRMGSLFKFDAFSSALTNANQIISGGSGSGKSYLTNLMIGQMLCQNPRIFILDVGGSYQKTCELLDGQYIPLSMSTGLSMNPFDLTAGTAVSDEKIKFLLALVQIMTKEEDQRAIGKLEKSEIELAIQQVYVEKPKPTLTHLRDKLMQSEVAEVQRIGKILSLWCGNSPFGKMLDRETTISFDKRIVCFDLKGLEANPDLQAAVLFTITDMVWREVQKDRSEMKFLVFDECWRLLESDAGSQFVGEVFRTFRKYFASAIAISQNIDDFAKSKAASAIMPNASIKWILKQPGADFKRLAEVLRLNEREVALVQSLSQIKGQYSEAFLMCEDKKAVVSVESTPIEYWLATTDPKDFALMKREEAATQKKNIELIQYLAEKFPMGATTAQPSAKGA